MTSTVMEKLSAAPGTRCDINAPGDRRPQTERARRNAPHHRASDKDVAATSCPTYGTSATIRSPTLQPRRPTDARSGVATHTRADTIRQQEQPPRTKTIRTKTPSPPTRDAARARKRVTTRPTTKTLRGPRRMPEGRRRTSGRPRGCTEDAWRKQEVRGCPRHRFKGWSTKRRPQN